MNNSIPITALATALKGKTKIYFATDNSSSTHRHHYNIRTSDSTCSPLTWFFEQMSKRCSLDSDSPRHQRPSDAHFDSSPVHPSPPSRLHRHNLRSQTQRRSSTAGQASRERLLRHLPSPRKAWKEANKRGAGDETRQDTEARLTGWRVTMWNVVSC